MKNYIFILLFFLNSACNNSKKKEVIPTNQSIAKQKIAKTENGFSMELIYTILHEERVPGYDKSPSLWYYIQIKNETSQCITLSKGDSFEIQNPKGDSFSFPNSNDILIQSNSSVLKQVIYVPINSSSKQLETLIKPSVNYKINNTISEIEEKCKKIRYKNNIYPVKISSEMTWCKGSNKKCNNMPSIIQNLPLR